MRLEPGPSGMWNKNYTARPKFCMKSEEVKQGHIRTLNKQRQAGKVSVTCFFQLYNNNWFRKD